MAHPLIQVFEFLTAGSSANYKSALLLVGTKVVAEVWLMDTFLLKDRVLRLVLAQHPNLPLSKACCK